MSPTPREILDALPDGVLVVEGDAVVWANAAFRALVGGEVAGLPLAGLLEPGAPTRLQRDLTLRRQGARLSATLRLRLRTLSGGLVPVDVSVRGTEGERRLLCARDATGSARAEELAGRLAQLVSEGQAAMDLDALLDASEPVFRALDWRTLLYEVTPEGLRTVRRLGFPEGASSPLRRYAEAFATDAAPVPLESLTLVRQAVLEGRPLFLDELPSRLRDAGPVTRAFARALEASGLTRGAWVPIRSADRWSHVLVVLAPDLTEHDFVAVQLFAAQIASAVRLAGLGAALVRRERLAALGEMAAVLAHEVRNPLGVVFNVAVGLGRMVAGDPDALRCLGTINEEAERLKLVVSELLDFARPAVPEVRAVPLAPEVEAAASAASGDGSVASKRVDFQAILPEDLPPVEADPVLLRRCLRAMLLNAWQHVPDGGRIRVEASERGDYVLVRLINDGPPIPPEVAPHLFEPFFTTKPSGSGLGLAAVRRVLEDLGGQVELESAKRGVSFALWLRRAEADA